MFKIRRAEARGHLNHGWLDAHHTFSFGSYYDPAHMGFHTLRVMNEDRVAPGRGFGTHPHNDMEIVTYVLSGALEHRDSMGNGEVLRPGEFQRMTAGTGITHSEFNPSKDEPTHLYQIWLLPDRKGHTPSYEQKAFPPETMTNEFRLVASPDAADGSLAIHQNARILLARVEPGRTVNYEFAPGRSGWLQVLRGSVTLNGESMATSDGAAIEDEERLVIQATDDAEVMLFDLP